MNKTIIIATIILWCIISGCRDESGKAVNLECKNGYYVFNTQPGKTYSIILNADDGIPVGETLDTADKLKQSPISRMYKKAFIIKADDLEDPISDGFKRVKKLIEECNAKAALGIITCYIGKTADGTEWLRNLDKNRFELFHHGWDHHKIIANWSKLLSMEFWHSGYENQRDSIARGIDAGKKYLGWTFHSFGAPFNFIDPDTQKAVLANPDIKVWLYGRQNRQNRYLTIKHEKDTNLEGTDGKAKNADELIKIYQSYKDKEVITAQMHPDLWDEADLPNLKRLLEYINSDPERRFFTPWEYYTWINDKNKIRLSKTGSKEYILDMSLTQYPHLIEFQADTTIAVGIR